MKLFLTAALTISMTTAALAQTQPTREDISAFVSTDASDAFSCKRMTRIIQDIPSMADMRRQDWIDEGASAKVCLDDVRDETSQNSRATRVPRYMLIISCQWLDKHSRNTIVACDGVNVNE